MQQRSMPSGYWRRVFSAATPLDVAVTAELEAGATFDFLYASTCSAASGHLRLRLAGEPAQSFRDGRDVETFAGFAAEHPEAIAASYFLLGTILDVYAVLVDEEPQLICTLLHNRPMTPAAGQLSS